MRIERGQGFRINPETDGDKPQYGLVIEADEEYDRIRFVMVMPIHDFEGAFPCRLI